jgi:pimeloyl-ACP methyl ester carboxylesterase
MPAGLGFCDIRDSALRLAEQIDELAAARPRFERIDVVAHSLGGLVATYLLKCIDHGRRVRRVLALGSPFEGVRAAAFGAALLGPFGCSLRQMRPDSPLLRRLRVLPVPIGSALVSIHGSRDWLVPPASSRLPVAPGHYDLDAGACHHWQLLFGAPAFACVEEVLAATPRELQLHSRYRGGSAKSRRATSPPPSESSRVALPCCSVHTVARYRPAATPSMRNTPRASGIA